MIVTDFEYDGLLLSDFGCIMCSFDSTGLETVSNGSNITFNTSPILNGSKHVLNNIKYEECLTATFEICKNPCRVVNQQDMVFTIEEVTALTRWLNRKEFLKFRLLKDGYENTYFDGSFNVSRKLLGSDVIGFELELTTNRPYGYYDDIKKTFKITKNNQTEIFKDISDEIGYIYPKTEITCNARGDLRIYNAIEDRETIIKNCQAGEVITMEYPVISSSNPNHKIQNDFNYTFFRVANTYDERGNRITFSLPCTMKITYQPIRKVGV